MSYLIEIREILSKIVEIEANSEEEAFDLVQEQYIAGKHELDYNHYENTEYHLA